MSKSNLFTDIHEENAAVIQLLQEIAAQADRSKFMAFIIEKLPEDVARKMLEQLERSIKANQELFKLIQDYNTLRHAGTTTESYTSAH